MRGYGTGRLEELHPVATLRCNPIHPVELPPGARVRPSNNWVSYQPTIGYLTNSVVKVDGDRHSQVRWHGGDRKDTGQTDKPMTMGAGVAWRHRSFPGEINILM